MAATNGVNGSKHYNEGTFLFTVSYRLCRRRVVFGHIFFSLRASDR